MNLRDLRYLVAVADHRHFGRAAEASFVAQPTLSTQIKKLEEELGVQLIERTHKGVLMTRVGEQIVERARLALRAADAVRDLARLAKDPESGACKLGLFPTLGPYLLPHAVPALRERFPKLELLLIEEKTEELLSQLDQGRIDVAVLALPVPEEVFDVVPLFEEPFVLAVPEGRAEEFHGPIDLGELHGREMLLLQEGHCMRDQALSVCGLAGAGERQGFRATSLETLRQMVAAGSGITLLPQLSVLPPVAPNPAIRLYEFESPAPKRTLGLCWRRSDARTILMQGLAAVLRRVGKEVLGNALEPARGRRSLKLRSA